MADLYRLIYFAELKRGRERYRVEFHQKQHPPYGGGYPDPMEIGDVIQNLVLDVQGDMDDIDTPIVKTSLTISMVDAPEQTTAQVKCGGWDVFYTPDATGWMVVLLGMEDRDEIYRTLWSGYITPDSYIETLKHRGVVTITARDNIGYLQELTFDAEGNSEGMITPHELFIRAWEKTGNPMILDQRGAYDSNEWPQCNGENSIDTYISVNAFKDRTWYDALYETLYSLGLTMRFIGRNIVHISTLRQMPKQGEEFLSDLREVEPSFISYATRELKPAAKEIYEEDNYDLQEGEDQPQVNKDDYDGTTVSCVINVKNAFGVVTQKQISVWPVNNTGDTGWGNVKSNTLFFDITRYNISSSVEPAKDQTFLALDSEPRMVWYGRNIFCRPMTLKIEEGMMVQRFGEDITFIPSIAYESITVKCAIKLTHNGVEYFYDGQTWDEELKELSLAFKDGIIETDIYFGTKDGPALLQLFIFSIDVKWRSGNSTDKGNFLGIKSLNFSNSKSVSMLEKNVVNTKYAGQNNLRLNRYPALVPSFDEAALPGLIKNGIFIKTGNAYAPAPEWAWPSGNDQEPMQLPALIHKQLLCYHSKPNNLISGTLINGSILTPARLWVWNGSRHILLSGTYNLINGHIENAVLREFLSYEELWK